MWLLCLLVLYAHMSWPCHLLPPLPDEDLCPVLFTRAMKGDIVPVLLPPDAAAEHF